MEGFAWNGYPSASNWYPFGKIGTRFARTGTRFPGLLQLSGENLTRFHPQNAAADLAKQAEREYRARDAAMPDMTQALRDARDLLLVANRDNPKALGDFGYVVDDSPQAKAKPTP